jgi:Fe2+ transport system protein B
MSDKQPTTEEAISNYIQTVNAEKQKMIDAMSKQEMVNLIFKQNNLMAQQSSQMIDIINMANTIEDNVRKDVEKKCSAQIINKCSQTENQQNDQNKTGVYENAMRTHIVLLILLVVVLCWLMYHHSLGCK